MKKFWKVLPSIILMTLLAIPVFADNAGDLDKHSNVQTATALADASSGVCAEVDADGNLQVEVAGGISGTFTASNVGITSHVPGTAATNLGKAEDAAHTSADTGVAILGVRNDTIAALAGTDGDYAPIQVDANGYLAVSSAVEAAEDAASSGAETGVYVLAVKDDALADVSADGDFSSLTVGAEGALYVCGDQPEDTAHSTGDYGFQTLAVRNDTLANLAGTDGDYAPLQVSAEGGLFVIGDQPEDTAHSTGDYGMMILAVRQDTQAALAGTSGDYSPLSVSATGALVTTLSGTSATDYGKAEDAAHTTGDSGVAMLAVRSDTATMLANTDGDYLPLITDAEGHLWVTQEGTVAEDTAHTSGIEGLTVLGVRNDALAALAGTDGDNAVLQVGAEGAVFVMGDQPEDSAHTSTDYGFQMLAVRNDTIAALAGTDGDYAPLQVDATGYLAVASGAENAEDAASSGADTGVYVLAVKDDALADVSADADFSSFTVGAEGALYVMGDQVEDTAAGDGDYGLPILAVRNDALAALAGTDGDYGTLQVNDIGALFVTGEHAEDAAHASGDYGNQVLTVRNDELAALGGADGDYQPLQSDSNGALYVNPYQETTIAAGAVGDAQAGLTLLAASGGTSKNRVYKITFMDAAAEVHTITELSGFTKVYTQAGGSTVIDFGPNGLLQTTANTAITTTSADGSATQVVVLYSVEGT